MKALFVGIVLGMTIGWFSGCGAPHPVPAVPIALDSRLSLSPDFTPEEVELIAEAAERWNLATGGETSFSVCIGCPGVPVTRGVTDSAHAGEAYLVSGRIALAPLVRRADGLPSEEDTVFRTATMHEIGHLLGLEHSSATTDVMYPTVMGPGELTAADVAAFQARLQ